jgi:hypothetical protein
MAEHFAVFEDVNPDGTLNASTVDNMIHLIGLSDFPFIRTVMQLTMLTLFHFDG